MLDRARDYTTKDGAQFLANHITQFWAARGRRVRVQVVPDPFNRNGLSPSFVVRSEMMGGRP